MIFKYRSKTVEGLLREVGYECCQNAAIDSATQAGANLNVAS